MSKLNPLHSFKISGTSLKHIKVASLMAQADPRIRPLHQSSHVVSAPKPLAIVSHKKTSRSSLFIIFLHMKQITRHDNSTGTLKRELKNK